MERRVERNLLTIVLISAMGGVLATPSCSKDLPADQVDNDHDMLPDQSEDRNQNGVVDPGETDPNAVDTDNDGIDDDAEVSTLACAKANDRPFAVFDAPGADSEVLLDERVRVRQTLRTSDNKAPGAVFMDPDLSVAGVLIGKRPAAGVATPSAQRDFERQSAIAQIGQIQNQQTRSFTTVQGYLAEQARFTVRAAQATTAARTANGLGSLFLGGVPLTGTLAPDGPSGVDLQINLLTIYRGQMSVVLLASVVVGADPTGDQQIRAEELTDGTNVARHGSFTRHVCDQFVASEKAAADILWVVDDSGSMEDDQMAVREAADAMADILGAAQVDYRLGVARTYAQNQNDPRRGTLVGRDLTRDLDVFRDRIVVGAQGGWEPGLAVGLRAIENLSPPTPVGQELPTKLRQDAALIVIHLSDERDQDVECAACGGCEEKEGSQDFCTDPAGQAVVDDFIEQYNAHNAVTFALVGDLPNGCQQTSTRDDFEPGQGYVEVANATGGNFGSLCGDMRMNLENVAFAATGIASAYQLSATPASATIRVAVGPPGQGRVIPRSRDNGFDYDPVQNKIIFFGDSRPHKDDEVVVGYRRWDWAGNPNSPADPCDDCSLGSFCNPELDIADCQAICGDVVCDAGLACLPDTAGCGNPNDLPPPGDACGGCGAGQVCDPGSEQCVPPCEQTGCSAGQVCSMTSHLCQVPNF